MLVDSAALNAAIVGAVSILTLILRRFFSKHDTAYDNMIRDSRMQRAQLDWNRAVVIILDEENWDLREALKQQGIVVAPRRTWPPFPEMQERP